MNPSRSLRPKLALAAGVFLAALLSVELGLRVAGYDPLAGLEIDDWRELFVRPSKNPLLVYEPTPGARGKGWGCDIAINSRGFRDREYALAKPAGVQRIVALGDSITFGNMLPVSKTWPEVLERLLASVKIRAEVLNLGVGGYDTFEEVAFLEQTGLAFDPDLVVVGFCVNDLGIVSLNHSYVENLERYGSWLHRSRLWTWLRLRLDRQSLVQGFVRSNEDAIFAERQRDSIASLDGDLELESLMARMRAALPAELGALADHPLLAWYASPAHVGHLRFAFERLAQLRVEHGFAVLIAVLPCLVEAPFQELYDIAYDIVLHEARASGLDTLDLRAQVRAAGGASMQIDPTDRIHFDARGHLLIGREIGRELVERGLVER